MHKLLFPCSMLLSIAAIAQEAPAGHQSDKPSRWHIGLNVSPQINYRMLRATSGDEVSKQITESRNEMDIPRIQYTAGVQLGYQLCKHITLNSGLQYGNWGGQTKFRDLTFGSPNPTLPNKARTATNMQYLAVPLTANVTFGHQRLKFTAGAGFSVNYLFSDKEIMILKFADGHTDRRSNTPDYYNKWNIAPQISAGVDYAFNNKVHLKLEPIFRFGMMKTVDAPVKENLYNYGLNIAAYWKI